MKRFGFFGGTFDPIHLGHLNLARSLLEKHHLDHVFFSPANFSPEKGSVPPKASTKDRKAMVQLAIEGIEEFSLIDLELEREGPSYTIDTIQFLMKEYPEEQFYLILGEDVLEGLPRWKEIDTLLELAPPLVGTRPNAKIPKLPPLIQKTIEKGKTAITPMEISSTDLREGLSQKKAYTDLIPPKVLDYIHTHRLY